MKRLLISLILLSVWPLQAVFYSSSAQQTATKKPQKKNDDGIVYFDTAAALQVYNECINGASGDFKQTGCKSEQCWRTCEKIGHIVDKAKKEKVYEKFAACVFARGELRKGKWGKRGCRIRDPYCFGQCEARAAKGLYIRSYPCPQIPPAPQPKPVHKKAVVDSVTKTTDTPQSTPVKTTATKGLFWGKNS